MKISFSPPDVSEAEIREVVEALKSGWITTGPKTKEFEREIAQYCGTKKAVCLNSATAGLELILRILGIGEGDEVITTAYTYTASAAVIAHVGAKIVFCDVKKDTCVIDLDKLAKAITPRTKAVIAVDIAGVICDYDTIFKIVEEKKSLFTPKTPLQETFGRVVVISDGAHSFGSIGKGKKSGDIADFTSFSFHAVKNLTTAEGGAVTWKSHDGLDDEAIYREFMLWSLHGQSKDALAKTKMGAWEYDVVMCGQKCNMTDIMAGIGLAQLHRYEGLLARRKEIIDMYNGELANTRVMPIAHCGEDYKGNGHLYITRIKGADVKERNEIIEKAAERGIATNVHYKPLPMMTAYKNLGYKIEDYPNAYDFYRNEITLPLHTLLKDEEVFYITENLKDILNNGR